MDSLHSSIAPAWEPPRRLGLNGRFAALLAAAAHGLGLGRQEERRLRSMSLATGWWLAMGAGALAAAALLGATVASLQERARAQQVAAQALAYAEQELDALDTELALLARELQATGGSDACSPERMALLVERSLSSLAMRRVAVLDADGGMACAPAGTLFALDTPAPGDDRTRLVASKAIGRDLVALRSLGNGETLAAQLDPRALQPRADTGQDWAVPAHRRIELRTAAQRLLAWGVAGIDHPQPWLRAERGSQRHALSLVVETESRRLHRAIAAAWAIVLPSTLLALLLAAGWVWRRTVLRARLYHRLRNALRKRQFEPFVQPIVDVASGRCVGGEILMRWAHPQRGVLGPGEFIDEAERTGLIVGMSDLIMQRAAHRLAPLAAAHPELYFSFNITPEQLRGARFAQELAELFNPETLRREQVLLELTERDFMDPVARQNLLALRQAGWRLAIDDFGTGQSSLAAVEKLPVDRIKIDRAFVSAIDEATVSRPVLDAIIALARQLGVSLVAEGVETHSQWNYLAAREVAAVQGFLIARPMPVEDFLRWFQEQLQAPQGPMFAAPDGQTCPSLVDTDTQALCQRLAGPSGVDIRDRLFRLRRYERCFVGHEAVDWLVREQRVTRAEAVRIGRRLLALGLIQHVLDEHDFDDAELFYRMAASSKPQTATAMAPAVEIVQALRQLDGGLLADHRRGGIRHRRCISGRDLLDWLQGRHGVGRPEAMRWAQQLMRQGRLQHVFDDEPFRDDATLYRPV